MGRKILAPEKTEKVFTDIHSKHILPIVVEQFLNQKCADCIEKSYHNIKDRKFRSAICALLGNFTQKSLIIGAVAEIIWCAFLDIDDMSDGASYRFHQPSAWKRCGHLISISSSSWAINHALGMLLDAGIQVPNVKIFLQSISDAFAAQIDQYLCSPDVSLDWYNNISIRKNNLAGIAWTAVLRESETSEYTLEMIRKMYDLCAAAGQMKNDLYDVSPHLNRARFNDFHASRISSPLLMLRASTSDMEFERFRAEFFGKELSVTEMSKAAAVLSRKGVYKDCVTIIRRYVVEAETYMERADIADATKDILASWLNNQFLWDLSI